MFDEVRAALTTLEAVVRDFEPKVLAADDARTMLELFVKGERLCAAGKALTANRIHDTGAYRASGHRSAGQLLADVSGTTVGAAESTLRAVQRLDDQPVVSDAFRAGELSEMQTREISYAASKSPESAERLVGYARKRPPDEGSEGEVRAGRGRVDRGRRRMVPAAPRDSFAAHLARARRARRRVPARARPAVGFHAALQAETDRLFREARSEGRRESRAAYMADALVNLVERGPAKPIDARVDVSDAALERGHVAEGERCEIPGVGPIPVTAAKRMLRDARVTMLVTDEADHISHVSSVTRTVPVKLRRWLETTYPVCGRKGCENARGLRIDHIHEYAKGGILDEHNAWRICGPCDDLKMHRGWVVVGSPGDWDLVPPDHRGALAGDRAPP